MQTRWQVSHPHQMMLQEMRQRNDSGCTCSSYFKEWKYKIRTENNQIVGPT